MSAQIAFDKIMQFWEFSFTCGQAPRKTRKHEKTGAQKERKSPERRIEIDPYRSQAEESGLAESGPGRGLPGRGLPGRGRSN